MLDELFQDFRISVRGLLRMTSYPEPKDAVWYVHGIFEDLRASARPYRGKGGSFLRL